MSSTELTEIENRYRQATADDMGIELGDFDVSKTVLLPEADRAGSSMVVAYRIGDLTALRCDPALEPELEEVTTAGEALSFDELRAWTAKLRWEFFDGGDTHLLLEGLTVKPIPDGATQVLLSRDSAEDRATIAGFLALSDPDDVDASEFELDDLDPFLLGFIDEAGQLGALVGGRLWEEDNNFDDIGILVRPDLRGKGWGSAVTSALCESSIERGRVPLYRCNWSRPASKSTAMTVGFKQVGTLLALKKPSP